MVGTLAAPGTPCTGLGCTEATPANSFMLGIKTERTSLGGPPAVCQVLCVTSQQGSPFAGATENAGEEGHDPICCAAVAGAAPPLSLSGGSLAWWGWLTQSARGGGGCPCARTYGHSRAG
jgi:hypothetical protein